jgi:phosphomannomutase
MKPRGAKEQMNKFIFDVDGTLTPSRRGMDAEFQGYFLDFCYANDVYLVTGSDYAKTLEQIGPDVCNAVTRIYNCNGNDVWEKGVNVRTNDWTLPEDAHEWLSVQLTESTYRTRTGLHFEHRPGLVNFSIVGRNADKEQRAEYVVHDELSDERNIIAKEFNLSFPNLQATVGGETGIDIAPLGADKSQIIEDFEVEDKLYFFGDRMDPAGNDYSLSLEVDIARPVKKWQETLELLQYFQEAKVAAT